MIRYALHCSVGHDFDSWFQSATALDTLLTSAMVSCPVCGAVSVTKALMAPSVVVARAHALPDPALPDPAPHNPSLPRPSLRSPANDHEVALAALRAEIEAKSEYVGMNFVTEARAIHDGDAPERAIYGEARPEEAIKLLQDGIQVAPLPFMPARKVN
jgi:hypothetical protein